MTDTHTTDSHWRLLWTRPDLMSSGSSSATTSRDFPRISCKPSSITVYSIEAHRRVPLGRHSSNSPQQRTPQRSTWNSTHIWQTIQSTSRAGQSGGWAQFLLKCAFDHSCLSFLFTFLTFSIMKLLLQSMYMLLNSQILSVRFGDFWQVRFVKLTLQSRLERIHPSRNFPCASFLSFVPQGPAPEATTILVSYHHTSVNADCSQNIL